MRLSPAVDMRRFGEMLECWVKECGCGIEYVQRCATNAVTALVEKNSWWIAIRDASKQFGVQLEPEIFPAATDSRYLREIGVPAIGISPIKQTKVLLHDHDEYLNRSVFIDGISWYELVLDRLGSVTRLNEPRAEDILAIQTA